MALPIIRRKRKPKARLSLQTYFKRIVYKKFKSNLKLATSSVAILDSMMEDIFDRIVTAASDLVRNVCKKTLTHRDIAFAVRLTIPGQLATHGNNSGKRALNASVGKCRPARSEHNTSESDSDHSSSQAGSLPYNTFSSRIRFHSSPVKE